MPHLMKPREQEQSDEELAVEDATLKGTPERVLNAVSDLVRGLDGVRDVVIISLSPGDGPGNAKCGLLCTLRRVELRAALDGMLKTLDMEDRRKPGARLT